MLVNCVAYQSGKKLADIAAEEIGRYVSRPECFVWVAIKDRQPAELAVMQREFGLHELAVEGALHGRDVYHLQRINQSIDSLREMVTTAMSVNLSLISLQENETTKRLAAYAALVAVPTLIAGLYGMNFERMPELRWALGYPVALCAMLVIDLYLFFRFRRAGWL